jgi:hypothetical protein
MSVVSIQFPSLLQSTNPTMFNNPKPPCPTKCHMLNRLITLHSQICKSHPSMVTITMFNLQDLHPYHLFGSLPMFTTSNMVYNSFPIS